MNTQYHYTFAVGACPRQFSFGTTWFLEALFTEPKDGDRNKIVYDFWGTEEEFSKIRAELQTVGLALDCIRRVEKSREDEFFALHELID